MEKMTISEFGRFLSEKRFGKIILCSDNQQDDSSGCPQKIDLIFRIIKTAVNPNVVCLQERWAPYVFGMSTTSQ